MRFFTFRGNFFSGVRFDSGKPFSGSGFRFSPHHDLLTVVVAAVVVVDVVAVVVVATVGLGSGVPVVPVRSTFAILLKSDAKFLNLHFRTCKFCSLNGVLFSTSELASSVHTLNGILFQGRTCKFCTLNGVLFSTSELASSVL
jgi:hypothetical protein